MMMMLSDNNNSRMPAGATDAPDPAYVDRLETTLTDAWQRRTRFTLTAQPSGAGRRSLTWRRAAMFIVVCLASMSLGAAGAIAVTHQPSPDFELLRVRAEAAVQIAKVARNAAAEQIAHVAPLVEGGYASQRELDEGNLALRQAEADHELA